MGTMHYKTFCLRWNILMLLVTLNTISQGLVESSQPLDKTKFGPAPKGTIKTIEVPEDGDMIDCVDIYKQPAFEDPLIKKDFQMIPSKTYESLFNGTKNSQSNIFQNWNRYGDCPKGSIPIRRTWNKYNRSIHRKTRNVDDDNYKNEYAIARQHGSIYNGAAATFTLWKPHVSGRKEFSLTQLWVSSDRNPPDNVIECGWTVNQLQYHDLQTRLFTYWTSDNYTRTGCYDLDCAGFVQTNHLWALGGVLNHVSDSGGQQVEMRISFSREETGRWVLTVQGTKIGYFPSSKFPNLRNGADMVDFGGEITNDMPENKHTSTHMGSGDFPGAGYKKASYMRNIQVISKYFETEDASLEKDITRAECYDLSFGPPETSWGTHFFYGGPGFSDKCFTP